MRKLKKPNRIYNLIDKLMYKFSVRSGPFMYKFRDEWRYVDHDGKLYRIVPTGTYEGIPLLIMQIER